MKVNPVGWFEIYVDDLERARKFYETVLGGSLQEIPAPDSSLSMLSFPMGDETGTSGALVHVEGMKAGGNSTMVYFSCEDCGVEGGRVEAAGGTVNRAKMSIGQYGFVVLVTDTEGNMIGLHSKN